MLFLIPLSTPLVGPSAHTLLHASLVGLSILVVAPNAHLVRSSDPLLNQVALLVSSNPGPSVFMIGLCAYLI